MKEFERERRLLQRKKRREQREADVAKGLGPGEVAPEAPPPFLDPSPSDRGEAEGQTGASPPDAGT